MIKENTMLLPDSPNQCQIRLGYREGGEGEGRLNKYGDEGLMGGRRGRERGRNGKEGRGKGEGKRKGKRGRKKSRKGKGKRMVNIVVEENERDGDN